MSIATLKKKSAVKYNNMSVSKPLFSLQGTHRSQGFVGQTTLSRSLPRTLMKNGGYKNYGGCCGTFKIGEIVQSSVKSTEDITVVKSSTINTLGLLHVNKYTCLWRPSPYTNVKMDSNHNLNSQSDYIKNVQKKALAEADACRTINTDKCSTLQSNTNCKLVRPRYTPFKNAGNWSKPESDFVAISQGEYLLKLDKKCGDIDAADYAQNKNNKCNKCVLPGNR
jgi:hypothetical protein